MGALYGKYGGTGLSASKGTSCSNALTGIVSNAAGNLYWRAPGLYVAYSPIADCNYGTLGAVVVEFSSIRKQLD